MSEPKLFNLLPVSESALSSGIFLSLLHPNNRPPHIGIIVYGCYMELSVQGPVFKDNLNAFLLAINKRAIPAVFIELIIPRIATFEIIRNEAVKILNEYDKVILGSTTCLSPVKRIISSFIHSPLEHHNYVFELLPELQQKRLVGKSYYVGMQKESKSLQEFTLTKYTMFDIKEEIRKYQNQIQNAL